MNKKSIPILKTERLILRPFTIDDAATVQQLAGNTAIASNTLNMPHPYLDGLAEAWIQTHEKEFLDGDSVIFAITLAETAQVIGSIGLMLRMPFQLGDLGYWVGEAFWNRGYCTEAANAVLIYAFDTLNLHKVTANYFSDNPASGKVMEKIGMFHEATFKSHLLHWGRFRDLEQFAIFNKNEK